MSFKRNIKRYVSSIVFSAVVVIFLIQSLEQPRGEHYFQLGIGTSSGCDMSLTASEEKAVIKEISLEQGLKLVEFAIPEMETLQLKFQGLKRGDTLRFEGLKYQRGLQEEIWREVRQLPGFETNGKPLPGKGILAPGEPLYINFNLTDESIGTYQHVALRVGAYGFILLVVAAFLFLLFSKINRLSWSSLGGYFLLSLILAFGLFKTLNTLITYPSRTYVDFHWNEAPSDAYEVDLILKPGKASGFNQIVNPKTEFTIPKLTKMEGKFYSLLLKLSGNDSEYSLHSLTISNALATKTYTGENLYQALFLSNDIKVTLDRRSGTVTLTPTGKNPFLVLSGEDLTFFRLVDRLLHNSMKLCSIIFWIFSFYIGILIIRQKRYGGIHEFIFVQIFLCIIFIPAILWTISLPTPYFLNEKRPAFSSEGLTDDELSEIPRNIDSYLSDHFGGRAAMVRASSMYKVLIFREASDVSPLAIGDEGWWYFTDEGLDDYMTNVNPITEEELKEVAQNLRERKFWLESHGSDFYLVFTPLKATVYPEFLPEKLKPINKPSRLERTVEYLQKHTDVNVVNTVPMLLGAKQVDRVYYKRDTHWNQFGAYAAYRQIIDSIKVDHSNIGAPKPIEQFLIHKFVNYDADLANVLGLKDVLPREDVVLIPKFENPVKEIPAADYDLKVRKSPTLAYLNPEAPNDLTIYYFRDSFTNYLIPVMNYHNKKGVYFWTHTFPLDAFDEQYPDIVIYEVLERFIEDLRKPNPQEVRDFYKSHHQANE